MKHKQLSFLETKLNSCAFTGHRELWEDFQIFNLETCVKELIEKGVSVFYCGMAKGFDLVAAETVLKEKQTHKNLKLVACIPYLGQERGYTEKDRARYIEILQKADEKIIFSDTFLKWKFSERNRFMADNADVLVAYIKKETGGTAYTVSYLEKKYPEKRIIRIS